MSRTLKHFLMALVCIGVGTAAVLGSIAARGVRQAAAERRARTLGSLSGVMIRSTDGRLLPATPEGGGVVMVVSTTCPHCHKLLADWARVAPGGGPRLHVLVLEGAADGRALLDSLLPGARSYESSLSRHDLIDRLRLSGTPTIMAVDANGQERDRVVGELSHAELARWVALAH